jgi:hypothetical protein
MTLTNVRVLLSCVLAVIFTGPVTGAEEVQLPELFRGRTEVVKLSGSWTVPTGVTTIQVELVGAGGGGQGDHLWTGTSNAGDGAATVVSVNGVVVRAESGEGASASFGYCGNPFPGAGGAASSNCDIGVTGMTGNSSPTVDHAAGGSPFKYGIGGVHGGVGWGYGGAGNDGSGCNTMISGGGAGGYCKKTFDVSSGDTVTVTVGAGGTAGPWGLVGARGVVFIAY